MLKTLSILLPVAVLIFAGGYLSGVRAAAPGNVYELRTYTTLEGKLENLNARFRNHTTRIFEKHGMTNIGYWTPMDGPTKSNTLIYIISHKSRDAAKASWDAFRTDPEWKKVAAESEKDGKINQKVESVLLEPTDYSKLK